MGTRCHYRGVGQGRNEADLAVYVVSFIFFKLNGIGAINKIQII